MSPKPQPWYAKFNQPPRSEKQHGRNWKPSKKTHSNPTDGADPGDYAGSHYAIPQSNTYSIKPPDPIPYAGIRAGEIIGHRIWMVFDEGLCSIAHYFIWEPGATIEGKVDEIIEHNLFFSWYPSIYGGVYCFDSFERLAKKEQKTLNYCSTNYPITVVFNNAIGPKSSQSRILKGIAIGTIKCWGEVIEHEEGWRAQYAKLQSIDYVIGKVDIDILRERYKVS